MANLPPRRLVQLTVRSGSIQRVRKQVQPSRREIVAGQTQPYYRDADRLEPEDVAVFWAALNTNVSKWQDGVYECEVRQVIENVSSEIRRYECVPIASGQKMPDEL